MSLAHGIIAWLTWGLLATTALTTALYAAQGLGFSRLSLPFLVGTWFSANRRRATIIGFAVYVVGGWIFAFLYLLFFRSIEYASWWLGAVLGLLHGAFLLVCALPLIPFVHPRMSSEYELAGPDTQLEPPGFMGLNYGRGTPLTTAFGHAIYGSILGLLMQLFGHNLTTFSS